MARSMDDDGWNFAWSPRASGIPVAPWCGSPWPIPACLAMLQRYFLLLNTGQRQRAQHGGRVRLKHGEWSMAHGAYLLVSKCHWHGQQAYPWQPEDNGIRKVTFCQGQGLTMLGQQFRIWIPTLANNIYYWQSHCFVILNYHLKTNHLQTNYNNKIQNVPPPCSSFFITIEPPRHECSVPV